MMREFHRQSRLFKVGIFSLAGSLVFAFAVLAVFNWPDSRSASAESDLATTEESTGLDTGPEKSTPPATPYVTEEKKRPK